MKSTFTAAASGLVLLSAAGAAKAEDPVTFFGYNLNASISAEYSPTYEGGKHYTVFPGGSLALTKPWEFDAFTSPDDAASIALLNTRRFSFGAAASVRENRGNHDELQGMRSIGWSVSGGGFMNVWPTHWMRIHVEGLKGLTAQSGIVVNSGIDFVSHPKYWNLAIGPRYSWGDDHFNGTYFGVTPQEATLSPYIQNPFHARAGSHFAGVEASAEYKWRPRWRITFEGGYTRMLGDDAASPLVRQLGSTDQFAVSTGLRFLLGKP